MANLGIAPHVIEAVLDHVSGHKHGVAGVYNLAAYEREIQQAQAAGIDGFALNVGGWLNQTYYIVYSAQIFEAAVRLNSGFKLMFSADMCCGNGLNDVEDMVRRFANDPRYSQVYFKFNGKVVLTTFSGDNMGTSFWQQVRSDLATGSNPSTTSEPNALAEVSGVDTARSRPNYLDYLIPSVRQRRANTSDEQLPVVDGLLGYRLPDDADYRTPWERGDDGAIAEYELAMIRRSAANMRALGLFVNQGD